MAARIDDLARARLASLSDADVARLMSEAYTMRGVNDDFRDKLLIEGARRIGSLSAIVRNSK